MFIGYENKGEKRGIFIGSQKKEDTEKRSYSLTEIKSLKDVFPGLFGETVSGVSVTEDSAMSLSSVFSAVRVISEDLASVPLEVIRTRNNRKEKDNKHPLYRLIHDEPNHYQTAMTFYDNLASMVNLWGNAFAKIHRNIYNEPVELEIIHPSKVTFTLYNRKLWYGITGETKIIDSADMIHICGPSFDGIAGVSMIGLHRETIGGGLAAQQYGNSFYKNGASLNGLLTSEQRLDDKQITSYADKWNSKYSGGAHKAHQTAVLGSGLKYQAIGVPPEDAQYIETKKFSRSEIAGIFRVKAHKINDLEKATFSNIEHLSIEHVVDTIRPWAKRFEQEFERKLLSAKDKESISLKFNLNALLRGDAKSRVEFYKGMQAVGAYSPNDILLHEGENTYSDGDLKIIMSNQMPVDQLKAFYEAKIKEIENKTNSNGNTQE